MRQPTKLALLAAAGCAAVATAACSSPSTGTPAAAPSASVGVGSVPDEGTGSAASPSASSTASRAASPTRTTAAPSEKPSTGQGGQSGEVNWKQVAFRTLGCKHHSDLPDRAEVQHIDHADVTGDGRRETIVTASCPTTTSTNAVHVFVFDGSGSKKPLLSVGKTQYLRTAEVQVSGRKITIKAEALSNDAPLCCPDERLTQTWTWTGSSFDSKGPTVDKIN
jgi:hypothetical protein